MASIYFNESNIIEVKPILKENSRNNLEALINLNNTYLRGSQSSLKKSLVKQVNVYFGTNYTAIYN